MRFLVEAMKWKRFIGPLKVTENAPPPSAGTSRASPLCLRSNWEEALLAPAAAQAKLSSWQGAEMETDLKQLVLVSGAKKMQLFLRLENLPQDFQEGWKGVCRWRVEGCGDFCCSSCTFLP